MKKYLLVSLFVLMSGLTVKGQFLVASYGNVHSWDIPDPVAYTVSEEFWNYNLIHAERFTYNGHVRFTLTLQNGSVFKEVSFNRRGRILEVSRFNYYPLNGHLCDEFCGFHSNYYYTYYRPYKTGHQHYAGCGHYVPKVTIAYHGHNVKVYPQHTYAYGKKAKNHKHKSEVHYQPDYRRARSQQHVVSSDNGRTSRGYTYSNARSRGRSTGKYK